jgi:hypothetical protein
MKRASFYSSLLLSGLLFAQAGFAQDWSDLSARQQRQLEDFRGIWSQLDGNRKRQLIGSAEQISRMTPANRRKLFNSMQRSTRDGSGSGR